MRELGVGRLVRRVRAQGQGPWILASALGLGALLAPLGIAATGDTLREGQRNPSRSSATRETQIIARTAANTYGTRQSNLGQGGGAVYGCRSTLDAAAPQDPARSTPCVRVNNLNDGLAFQFRFDGALGGVIQSGGGFGANGQARPFITNATAVALGLNADQVDGMDVSQIIAAARAGSAGTAGPQGPAGPAGARGPSDARSAPSDSTNFQGVEQTIATLALPAGNWAVKAKTIGNNNAVEAAEVTCSLVAGAGTIDDLGNGITVGADAAAPPQIAADRIEITLEGVATLAAAGSATFACNTNGSDEGNFTGSRMTAIQVGSLG